MHIPPVEAPLSGLRYPGEHTYCSTEIQILSTNDIQAIDTVE